MKNYLCLIVCLYVIPCFGNDTDKYKTKYPDAEFVTLEKSVSITYFNDPTSGQLKAKAVHKIQQLALKDNCSAIELVQIPFTSFEDLSLQSAKYYQLEANDQKVLKENVKVKHAEIKDYYIDGIFYNDLQVKQFSPRLKVTQGTLLEYQYEIIYNDLKFLNRFYIQEEEEIVEKFNFQIHIPSNVKADLRLFNIEEGKLKENVKKFSDHKVVHYEGEELLGISQNRKFAPHNYYIPHIIVLTKSWESKEKTENILNSVDDLFGWYHSLVLQLNPDKAAIKKVSDHILNGEKDQKKTIEKIFKWVQRNIHYVAFEDGLAGFKPEEAHQVLQTSYGDCKGMANLLVELLKANNIPAYHTWIGTRSIPYDYSIPSLVVDNHMITTVLIDGKYYFLDPTDKTTNWDTPSSHIQGQMAMVGIDKTYKLLKVPVNKHDENKVVVKARIHLSEQKTLPIQGNIVLKGLEKDSFYSWYTSASSQKQKQANHIMASYFIQDMNSHQKEEGWERNAVLNIPIKGNISGRHFVNNNLIYLWLDMDQAVIPFGSKRSLTPVHFENTKNISYEIEYVLPPGSKVVEIPQPVFIDSPNGEFKYAKRVMQSGNSIFIKSELLVDTLLVPKESLAHWTKFLSAVDAISSQPLILTIR